MIKHIESFDQLELPEHILKAIQDLGYEQPSPIQSEAIPALLKGEDILGQAQTGTGKTAAFALPILANIDTTQSHTQVLILAPTRELAIQVAEACQSYAKYIKDFHVLPIYGGQSYSNQLRQLKRGVQIVVGTPGRVMDHMRRGTLSLAKLSTLVLDEADEMLRMGFIDDVKWILEHTPESRQIALFSATMPAQIKLVADTYLNAPKHIKIEAKSSTAQTIKQRYWVMKGIHKLDALTRILEMEPFDGIIVFVRTKLATEELATKLNARGFSASALNGDIPQAAREKTVDRLKSGQIDILVATDVVARGLDVERISHVINYDVPYDTESYIHRIGRTGRAGRSGDAILFIAPREKRMLRAIEKASGKTIEAMPIPTAAQINEKRIAEFQQSVIDCLQTRDLSFYQNIIDSIINENDADPREIAAALAHIAQGNKPLVLDTRNDEKLNEDPRGDSSERKTKSRKPRSKFGGPIRPLREHPDVALERFIIQVGHNDGATPGQIVAAIANASDLSSEYIGQIEIEDSETSVDLPEGMPRAVLKLLQKARVANKAMNLQPFKGNTEDKTGKKENQDKPNRASKNKARQGAPSANRKAKPKSKKTKAKKIQR